MLHAVKESVGEIEGRAFSSTKFHLEVDLKDNGVGRSIGRVTREFKCGDAKEFDKWVNFRDSLPCLVEATFEMEATKDGSRLALVDVVPVSKSPIGKAA
ncbi:hypothetical protein [Pseudorhodoferax sp.]|uniref:hypothetical protein n=1 Tax=Pseudorhodoferax sp. TaxID=1993553 RepID=UPI0039E37497